MAPIIGFHGDLLGYVQHHRISLDRPGGDLIHLGLVLEKNRVSAGGVMG